MFSRLQINKAAQGTPAIQDKKPPKVINYTRLKRFSFYKVRMEGSKVLEMT